MGHLISPSHTIPNRLPVEPRQWSLGRINQWAELIP